ncbi:phosphoglycolate phosphatase [Sphingopyxis bauzanensis]|uniref:phosphoglycolate phosphatase n=1 Tax=Sphingopyxis bauzanensis TaxID=651663 RepID=A0A246JRV8_9SPHN|nr:HAD-IA family hydrolase [Sphingopyxis bauzanensis]OWQ95576.1 phosphoglycolate phosphatase [Sphingopyxis bauzanensis]GGJ38080.1 phosphoglycolate phosphatase, bacterial [Sphingopyxis bauzanensis]
MSFPFATVGFDLDGTLVDTAGDLTAAVNLALCLAARAPLPEAEVRPMIGLGARHMLERGFAATGGIPGGDFERLYRELLRFYEAHIAVQSRVFPGLIAALDRLDTLGVKTAVVTNKREDMARKLLGELGLVDRMATIIGGDTLGPGNAKPSPAPIIEMVARCGGGRAAFVGDSIYDVMAANSSGVTSIAVSFGFLDRPADELGADHVIDHFNDLVPLLTRL